MAPSVVESGPAVETEAEVPRDAGEAPPGPRAAGPTPNVGEELARVPYEPFLPAEAKLVTWSLLLGLALLGLLVYVSSTFYAP